MKYIIDRFEGDYAVVEDENRSMMDILIKNLPEGAREGDVLVKIDDGYIIDVEETKRRKRKTQGMIDELWE